MDITNPLLTQLPGNNESCSAGDYGISWLLRVIDRKTQDGQDCTRFTRTSASATGQLEKIAALVASTRSATHNDQSYHLYQQCSSTGTRSAGAKDRVSTTTCYGLDPTCNLRRPCPPPVTSIPGTNPTQSSRGAATYRGKTEKYARKP